MLSNKSLNTLCNNPIMFYGEGLMNNTAEMLARMSYLHNYYNPCK